MTFFQDMPRFKRTDELKKWIIKYLMDNCSQKISEKETSIMTKSVLVLTKKMVLAGVFESTAVKGKKHELVIYLLVIYSNIQLPALIMLLDGQSDDTKLKGSVSTHVNRFKEDGYNIPVMVMLP